jgi:hypothetical protein
LKYSKGFSERKMQLIHTIFAEFLIAEPICPIHQPSPALNSRTGNTDLHRFLQYDANLRV